jgi:proteasome lid subunit RPN8/RPN11
VDEFVGADLMGQDLVVRADRRIYETRGGIIKCLAPAKPPSDEPDVYVEGVDWQGFPPRNHLAWLFYSFFCKYTDREVVMLVGKRLDGMGWLYYVPEQVGTCGSVRWTADDEEMGQFQEQARWIGTVHSHPGNCCKPSQTDIDDWADPEKSGMHVVFGRDGSFTVNGAIAERTFELLSGRVCREESWTRERYQTSKGRSLKELLKKPKPPVTRIVQRGAVWTQRPSKRSQRYHHEGGHAQTMWDPETGLPLWDNDEKDGGDFVEETLDVVGALPLGQGQDSGIPVLRIVEYNGQFHALTLQQYAELVEWCKGVCPVPKSERLRLYGARGGGR